MLSNVESGQNWNRSSIHSSNYELLYVNRSNYGTREVFLDFINEGVGDELVYGLLAINFPISKESKGSRSVTALMNDLSQSF